MENGEKSGEEWRLGIELGDHAVHREHEHPGGAPLSDRAAARLDRPLYVLTAEHLGWIVVAAYTVVTRTLALGARPLSPAEARGALVALALAHHALVPGYPISWATLAQSGFIASLGASGFAARLFAAGCGILLVAAAYAMRPYLGRAGALGMAAMLAISPTVLWYSRAGQDAMPAAAFAIVAVALLMASMRRPTMSRAIGAGASAALAISAGAVGIVAAVTAAAAGAAVGIVSAIAGGNAILRIRVWWARRAGLVISAAIVALVVWLIFTTGFFHASLAAALGAQVTPLFAGAASGFVHGIAFYAAIYLFYEFAVAIAALAGLVAIVTVRVRSRFAAWLAVWTIFSAAAYAAAPGLRPQFALGVIMPAAMLGAIGIDWIFRTRAWNVAAYVLAAVAAAAIYTQALTSVVYSAPDASEAPWARHALLFWSEPATTWQAREACRNAVRSAHGKTVAYAAGIDAPAVRWYLREMKPAPAGAAAAITVSAPAADSPTAAPPAMKPQFVLEQEWTPSLRALTARDALGYYLSQRAWAPIRGREIALTVRAPSQPTSSAATPAPAPSPGATASASATPTGTPSPATTPAPTGAPAAAATQAISPTATATLHPSATPSVTPSASPSATPTASQSASPSATPTPRAAGV